MKRKTFFASLAGFMLASLALTPSFAQVPSWPSKPVRLVVAYPPGGATDTQARLVGQKLSERWGQPVLVENRPGGNTVIATDLVAKAPADGHTLLLTAMPFALNPFLLDRLPYDTAKDLAPITVLTTITNVLVAHPSLGVKNVQELIQKAKDAPGSIGFASTGTAASTHLSGELFASMAKVSLTHVPYKGSAPAHQDLLGGRVPIMFDNGVLQHIKAGKVVALGVTSAKRLPWLPDVPTVAEQGLAGYETEAWYGIFTAAGTPKPVLDQIAKDMTWAVRSPDVKAKLEAIGASAGGGTPEEFGRYLASETERWGALIKQRGIRME